MALSFGVTSTGGYGVLNSVTTTYSTEVADARNALGKVTNQQAYSKTSEVSFDGLFNGDTLAPGTSVTVAGVTGILTTVAKTETNTEYQKVSGTISKKDAATQVAYSS